VKRQWIVDVVEHVPAGAVSRAWGWLARRRRPRLAVGLLKRAFIAGARIDMAEADAPTAAYASLEELFTRRLRSGVRPIDEAPDAIVSPVDGVVGACGTVEHDTLLQVKGRWYLLSKLLDDSEAARRFDGGPYCTLYLSPRDYHRVHAPLAGSVAEAVLVPGRLLPVFSEAVSSVDELFARNERLITYIETPTAGRLAVVKVGATMVGCIRAAYDLTARTNSRSRQRRTRHYEPPARLEKGAELGAFELGSTVVLVGEAGKLRFDALSAGQKVQVGERIGSLVAQAAARPRAGKVAAPTGEKDVPSRSAPGARRAGRGRRRAKG
jgi:phosphatidylserine decarboxylase